MSANSDLLTVMRAARADLEAEVAPYRDDLAATPHGEWTVRQSLAHIAVWERVSARTITGEEIPYGAEIADRASSDQDQDRFNAEYAALMADWSDEQILAEFEASHQALIAAVTKAPEEACAPGGEAWSTVYADGVGHYRLHFPVPDRMAGRWPDQTADI